MELTKFSLLYQDFYTFWFVDFPTLVGRVAKLCWQTLNSARFGTLTSSRTSLHCLFANRMRWWRLTVSIGGTSCWDIPPDYTNIAYWSCLPGSVHFPSHVHKSSSEHWHSDLDLGWQVFSPSSSCLQILLPGIVKQSALVPHVTMNYNSKHKGYFLKISLLPFLQTFSIPQYSPFSHLSLHELLFGLWQVFSPVLGDSVQTLRVLRFEQSEFERQGTKD